MSTWLIVGAGTAAAQTAPESPTPGVVFVDPLDPFGDLPPGFVNLEPGQPLPAEFLQGVPPEYAFFVDPSLPVPPEFAWLDDPTLPVPTEFMFLYDPRLPVPEEFAWLFEPIPVDPFGPVTVPLGTAAPEPELDSAGEPEESQSIDVTRITIAPDRSDVDNAPPTSDDKADPEQPVVLIMPNPVEDAPVAVLPPAPSSGSPVPLLIFVGVATIALLASIPVLLGRRTSTSNESTLRELALTDDLTQLANRRRLDRDLRTHERVQAPVTIAMIDIDHFKRLNDDFGHATGDVVLRQVAATISQNVRSADVVYRYGGEEFCVLLPNTTEYEAAAVVDRVRRTIESTPFDSINRAVTVSAGVAASISSSAADATSDTLHRADAALYEAKGAGRNRVMIG